MFMNGPLCYGCTADKGCLIEELYLSFHRCAKVLQSRKGSSPAHLLHTTGGSISLQGGSFSFGGPALDRGTEREEEEETASR